MKTKTLVAFIITAALCGLVAQRGRAQDIDSFAPVVVKTEPEAGATNVPPGEYIVHVTFSKEMTDQSWSWSTAWKDSAPEMIGKPNYSADHRVCTAAVKLEPGKTYGWWLNSQKFHGFQDTQGHPAVPYLLTFQTAAEGQSSSGHVVSPGIRINPATGLLATPGGTSIIDPNTGLPATSNAGNHPETESPASTATDSTGLHAAAETWSPTLAPGEKPDIQTIRGEIKTLMDQTHYEEALQRQIWYFNHALEYGEVNPVRLSFGIMNWGELGQRHPKAKAALKEIRDRDVRKFSEGQGYADLFLEVQSLNRQLQDDDATVALFKTVYQQDKPLAGQCFYYVQDSLMQKGEYALCLDCLGDAQARFESYRRGLEVERASLQRTAEFQKTHPLPAARFPAGGFTPPDMGQLATNDFVGQVCKLVEILVATDHQSDAEKIRDEAVAALDDPLLESAVSDAEQKIKK